MIWKPELVLLSPLSGLTLQTHVAIVANHSFRQLSHPEWHNNVEKINLIERTLQQQQASRLDRAVVTIVASHSFRQLSHSERHNNVEKINLIERKLQQQQAGQSCSNNRRKSLLPTIYKLVPTSTHKHIEKVEPICTNQQQYMGRMNLEAMWADDSAWTARPLFATPLLGLQEEVGKSRSEILDIK